MKSLAIWSPEEILSIWFVKINIYQIISISHILWKANMSFKSEFSWLYIAKTTNIATFYKTC